MSLKDYGWETYRVRSHSIPPSVSNTDNYQAIERRISKGATSSSPGKIISFHVTPPPSSSSLTTVDLLEHSTRRELTEPLSVDIAPSLRYNRHQDSNSSDLKSKRSLTMPSTILLNSNEKIDVRHGK